MPIRNDEEWKEQGKLTETGGQTVSYQAHPAWRMDKRAADLLNGLFDLSHLSHEGRVVSLYNLRTMWRAVQEMGWAVHTGDWDWEVTVHLADGTEYKAINLIYELQDCDTPTVDHAKVQVFRVAHEYEEDGDTIADSETWHEVAVDDVMYVYIEEL